MQLRIEELRKQRQLTVAALAQKVDVSSLIMWRLEHGVTPITLDRLTKIAQALDVPVTDLWIEQESVHVSA